MSEATRQKQDTSRMSETRLTTHGEKRAHYNSRLFIKLPRDLSHAGVKMQLVTGLKDIRQTVRVTGTN